MFQAGGVSPHVADAVLRSLFELLGPINHLRSYPSPGNAPTKECQVEFAEASAAQTALHLTGVELGDRALFITMSGQHVPRLASQPSHPSGAASMPLDAASSTSNVNHVILQLDPQKAEEIARTIYIGNISPLVTEDHLRSAFSDCGDVVAVKIAGDVTAGSRFAFLEFANQQSAAVGLSLNGLVIADRALKVNFSKNAITKPQVKLPPGTLNDPAMRRVAEAQAAILRKYDPTVSASTASSSLPAPTAASQPPEATPDSRAPILQGGEAEARIRATAGTERTLENEGDVGGHVLLIVDDDHDHDRDLGVPRVLALPTVEGRATVRVLGPGTGRLDEGTFAEIVIITASVGAANTLRPLLIHP
ncbi:Protein srek1IP1 [Thoreauomyces humboldtii]|nr:Protein srek1IP1 [Thoreauomyces humboldtii]